MPSAQAKVQPDGTFTTRIRFDLVAFLTGATPRKADDEAMNALVDGPDEALKASLADGERRFRAGFAALDGGKIDRLAFPTVADVRAFLASDPRPRLPVMLTATVAGHLPKAARMIAFRYPDTFDTIVQTVEFPYMEPISEPVEPGRPSATLTIPTAAEVARLSAVMNAPRRSEADKGAVAVVRTPKPSASPTAPQAKPEPAKAAARAAVASPPPSPLRGSAVEAFPKKVEVAAPKAPPASAKNPVPKPPEPVAPSISATPAPRPSSAGAQALTYLRMGYAHILPEGLDHILFVLGLFLLGSNTKALLKQITAFTVAHSITLALATLDVVRLPSRIIEPVIALSIAFVAIENLLTKEVRRSRTAVVFLFGLVHGMGFAEVFKDAGLSGRGLVSALLSFNVGVELGQLSVVAMALVAVGWFRKSPNYRRFVVVPASLAIALVALFWTVQRTTGIGV